MDVQIRAVLSRTLDRWFRSNSGWHGHAEHLMGSLLRELESEGLTIIRIKPPHEDPVVPESVSRERNAYDLTANHAAARKIRRRRDG